MALPPPGRFALDAQHMPLVVVSYEGVVTDAAFRAYLEEYEQLLQRGEPYGLVLDASRAGMPTPAQRILQANFLREREAAIRRLCRCGAFVITSPLVRGALTAILWLSGLPFEYTVVSRRSVAASWTCERLGMAVPRYLASA